jgi:hypothetical protein
MDQLELRGSHVMILNNRVPERIQCNRDVLSERSDFPVMSHNK